MMNIIKTENDGIITFLLDGWLDTASSPQLGAETDAITAASEIILDFDKVEYMASAGLRQVVACHRKAKELNAAFSVINVGNEAMSIFELTGIDKKINVTKAIPHN